MIVEGRKTTVEKVKVNVDPVEVVSNLFNEWLKSTAPGCEFLDIDARKWMKVSGYNSHTREDLYDEHREATNEEIFVYKSFRVVSHMAEKSRMRND